MHLEGLGALALSFFALAPAQALKVGDWYEDSVDLGFRIRMPRGWEFIPAAPDRPNRIGKYEAPEGQWLSDVASDTVWDYQAWLLEFDRRPEAKTALDAPPSVPSRK